MTGWHVMLLVRSNTIIQQALPQQGGSGVHPTSRAPHPDLPSLKHHLLFLGTGGRSPRQRAENQVGVQQPSSFHLRPCSHQEAELGPQDPSGEL